MHIFQKPVLTEDQIVQILASQGKPESHFWKNGSGMGDGEAESRFNSVLNSRNLKATRLPPITEAQLQAELDAGKTLIVKMIVKRFADPVSGTGYEDAGHAVVMRKVNGQVEIVNPAGSGKGFVDKLAMSDALNRYPVWDPGPPKTTSTIWRIEPTP